MSNTDVTWPIQTAIYDTLTADAQLDAVITGVHDEVPTDTRFPYVTIGDASSTPEGAHDRFGARSSVTLHVWSTYHGYKEALTIVGHLMRLLDQQQAITVDGHHLVAIRHEQTVTMRDPDPDVRHAAVRFAIETEYTP